MIKNQNKRICYTTDLSVECKHRDWTGYGTLYRSEVSQYSDNPQRRN